MKVPIHVLIDYELKVQLDKEHNKSEAVNQALFERYNSVKKLSLADKKKLLARIQLEKKHKAEMEELDKHG